MGNRVYFTLKSNQTNETYYTHWNGGLDTFAPLCRSVFDHEIKDKDQVINFFKHLELKPQKQDHPLASTWVEENGHYFIDLDKQTLEHRAENQSMAQWVPHLLDAFNNYVNRYIKEDYRPQHRSVYWDSILNEGEIFFKGR